MNHLFDALANAELSLFGILGEPFESLATSSYGTTGSYGTGAAAQDRAEPAFEFSEAHYRQAAG